MAGRTIHFADCKECQEKLACQETYTCDLCDANLCRECYDLDVYKLCKDCTINYINNIYKNVIDERKEIKR